MINLITIMSTPRDIQLGLCCLNTELREKKPTVFCSRTMIQKTVKEKGIDELKRRVLLNLDDLLNPNQTNYVSHKTIIFLDH